MGLGVEKRVRDGDDSRVCDDAILTVRSKGHDSEGNIVFVVVSAIAKGTATAQFIDEAQPGCEEIVIYGSEDPDGDRTMEVCYLSDEVAPSDNEWNRLRAKLGKAVEDTRRVDPW